jgi:hypothetical protein
MRDAAFVGLNRECRGGELFRRLLALIRSLRQRRSDCLVWRFDDEDQ